MGRRLAFIQLHEQLKDDHEYRQDMMLVTELPKSCGAAATSATAFTVSRSTGTP
jgi:hypothetical protein